MSDHSPRSGPKAVGTRVPSTESPTITLGGDPEQTRPMGAAPPLTRGEEAALVGKVVDGRYTILRILGVGGMGAVYQARQHSVDRDVALKVIRPDVADDPRTIRRFLREAEVVSRLANPHTVSIFDFGKTQEGMLYIAMEFLKGRSLSEVARLAPGPMDPMLAVRIVMQVLESLAEAHATGVIHRDIKPDNLFLVPAGRWNEFVKVLDFGVAKLLDPELTVLTQANMACGTPEFMSPEQARADPLDARSDLYSVGTVLFELLTHRLPFDGDTPIALVLNKVQHPAPRIRQVRPDAKVPPALEAVVARLLETDRDRRPSTAAEVQELLAAAMGGRDRVSDTQVALGPLPELATAPKPRRIPGWIVAALVGAGLAAAAGIALWAALGGG